MGYYETKRRFFTEVKDLITKIKEVDRAAIENYAIEQYGYNPRIVDETLKILEDNKYIKIKGNTVKLIDLKTE